MSPDPYPTRTDAQPAAGSTAGPSSAAESAAATLTDSAPNSPAGLSSDRYELRTEIARGGMGAVYRAIDHVLDREVAVKVLQDRFAGGSVVARRFVDEARIAGQLQHPNIPAVHDRGTLSDGRPFLAMKLVKGRTLEEHLRERPDPAADRGRFLAVFEQVCQAVAYAHSRKVIHRDLKPANIMVGAFGEVQVMDWGLAKVLTDRPTLPVGGDPNETVGTQVRSLRDSNESETQAGSVLGTPAFMPPEQAAGEVAKVDERADVFGLGAVLCVILTGKPPYVGRDAESVRVMAIRGELADCRARLDACGAEAGWIALAKQCLAFAPDDRPANAGVVADEAARLRADADDRARRAELDRARAEAEAKAQGQKRKAQLLAAAGLFWLVLVGGGAWAAIRAEAAARRADADRVAAVALGRVEELAAQAAALDPATVAEANAAVRTWEQAAAAVEQAESAAPDDGRVVERAREIRDGLAKARRDADLLAGLESTQGIDVATTGVYQDLRAISHAYRLAFVSAGLPPHSEPDALAAAIRSERPGLRSALVSALDDWAITIRLLPPRLIDPREKAWLWAAANGCDPDPFRMEVRAAADDKFALARLASRSEAGDQPPASTVLLANALSTLGYRAESLQVLRAARDRHPSDLQILATLAFTLRNSSPGDPVAAEEAVGCARSAVAAHPGRAQAYYLLGLTQWFARNDSAASEAAYRRAIALNPRFLFAHHNLGALMIRFGRTAEAETIFRKVIELDPEFVASYTTLGWIAEDRGDLAEAATLYRKVIELDPNETAHLRTRLKWIERLLPRLDHFEAVAAGREEPATPGEAGDFAYWLRTGTTSGTRPQPDCMPRGSRAIPGGRPCSFTTSGTTPRRPRCGPGWARGPMPRRTRPAGRPSASRHSSGCRPN